MISVLVPALTSANKEFIVASFIGFKLTTVCPDAILTNKNNMLMYKAL